MKALPKILFALTAVAALPIAYPASVQAAPTTYVYTGNPFTNVGGQYTTSMFVTAMVTLASPLGANHDLSTPVTVISFTISDGVQTLTSGLVENSFGTGPTGMITLWDVVVVGSSGSIFTALDPLFGASDQGLPASSTSE